MNNNHDDAVCWRLLLKAQISGQQGSTFPPPLSLPGRRTAVIARSDLCLLIDTWCLPDSHLVSGDSRQSCHLCCWPSNDKLFSLIFLSIIFMNFESRCSGWVWFAFWARFFSSTWLSMRVSFCQCWDTVEHLAILYSTVCCLCFSLGSSQ